MHILDNYIKYKYVESRAKKLYAKMENKFYGYEITDIFLSSKYSSSYSQVCCCFFQK